MHETSLIPELIEKVAGIARENNARRVTAVELEIGALAGFSPEHLREHFEEAAKGTIVEGAELRATVSEDPLSASAGGVRLMAVEVDS